MKLVSKLTIALTIAASLSAASAAQEPTKEETVDWLIEKVSEASLGCYAKREEPRGQQLRAFITNEFSQSLRRKTSSIFTLSESFKQSIDTQLPLGGMSNESRNYSNGWDFIPRSYDSESIKISHKTVRVSTRETDRSCHRLILPFVEDQRLSDGRTYENFQIHVNDYSLAERMKRAFEHLAKLEESGAGEPF